MKRHVQSLNPEVVPSDIETQKVYGGGRPINMVGAPPNIQPFQGMGGGNFGYDGGKTGKGRGSSMSAESKEGLQKAAAIAGAIWLGGWFLGYDLWWPLYLLMNILYTVLNIPPFSWLFGWVWTPLSWAFGWFYRGAPLVDSYGALQELRLPADQVSTYVDTYVQQYGDAALIFAAHDGYPQLVNSMVFNRDLGYRDLIDASDDSGNSALLYAASKGYRQTTAALLRSGANPDKANTAQGSGGRTALMEAAGAGHKEIAAAIRLSNATIDLQDDYGNTALIYAAYHGHLSIVIDLVKAGANIRITNHYGHTAASYAETNQQKGVVDYLKRAAKQPKRKDQPINPEDDPATADIREKLKDLLEKRMEIAKNSSEIHVKGGAEDLHKEDNFAPKLDPSEQSVSESERQALEAQVTKLKREHDEAELRSQRRVMELLEETSQKQRQVDEAERKSREARLNNTDLTLKVDELLSKQRSHELERLQHEDKHRALQDELRTHKLEVERLRSKSEATERDGGQEASRSKRYEEDSRRLQEEINDHLARHERMLGETARLRDDIRRADEERRRWQERVEELERKHGAAPAEAGSGTPEATTTSTSTPPDPGEQGVHADQKLVEAVKMDAHSDAAAATGGARTTAADGENISP